MTKVKASRSCIVHWCFTKNSTGLYKFPKDTEQRKKWLQSCALNSVKSYDKICSLHFCETDFHPRSRRLKKGSVPSKNLSFYQCHNDPSDLAIGAEIEIGSAKKLPPIVPTTFKQPAFVHSDHSYCKNPTKSHERHTNLEKKMNDLQIENRKLKRLVGVLRKNIEKLLSGKSSKEAKEEQLKNIVHGKFQFSAAQIRIMVSKKQNLNSKLWEEDPELITKVKFSAYVANSSYS